MSAAPMKYPIAILVMSPDCEAFWISEPKSSGPRDATGRGTDCVEEGDAQRPSLQREDLTDREVGRAGPGRGEEEDDRPAQGKRHCRKRAQDRAGYREQDARDDVRARDHANTSHGVEQAAEQESTEEVTGSESGYVPAGLLDAEEGIQRVAVGEEEGVVQERLADEEGEAQQRTPRVKSED